MNTRGTTVKQALAVAIGFFDGVHRGHQAVFQTLLSICQHHGFEPGVVTFPNHPRTLLTGEAVPLLTDCDEKCDLIRAAGIPAITVLPFTHELQQLDAAAFVEQILVNQLNVAHVVVGHDFHFGANRSGNGDRLTALGQYHGFNVTIVPAFHWEGQLISSRSIRQALQQGDLNRANTWLNRRYTLTGTVVKGQQLGRQLGVPTANVAYSPTRQLPANGVYAVSVDGPAFHNRIGVANIGYRPTVDASPTGDPLLEVHLLDADLHADALYGYPLTLHFVQYLRSEQRFNGLDALKTQIHHDIQQTRAVLEM
jgi:riboflavin kinase / FMN adenylyltransferase